LSGPPAEPIHPQEDAQSFPIVFCMILEIARFSDARGNKSGPRSSLATERFTSTKRTHKPAIKTAPKSPSLTPDPPGPPRDPPGTPRGTPRDPPGTPRDPSGVDKGTALVASWTPKRRKLQNHTKTNRKSMICGSRLGGGVGLGALCVRFVEATRPISAGGPWTALVASSTQNVGILKNIQKPIGNQWFLAPVLGGGCGLRGRWCAFRRGKTLDHSEGQIHLLPSSTCFPTPLPPSPGDPGRPKCDPPPSLEPPPEPPSDA